MGLQTHAEMAQMYRDAIRKIVEGGVSSVSVLGQSYTNLDLGTLEDQAKYHERKYSAAQFGIRSTVDMSTAK